MTAEENKELFLELNKYEKDSQEYLEIREKLFHKNEKLVLKFVQKYRKLLDSAASFEDMIAEGNIGLLKAIEDFDIDRGIEFSTVAFRYIKTEVLRWMNRVEFRRKFDTESYDEYTNEEESTTKIELIGKVDEDLENAVNLLDKLKLRKLLKQLNEQERSVIELKYLSGKLMSARDVANRIGVSFQRVQQIERKAIHNLKKLAAGQTSLDVEKEAERQKFLQRLKKYETYIDLLDPKEAESLRYAYFYYPNLNSKSLAKLFSISTTQFSKQKNEGEKNFNIMINRLEKGYIKQQSDRAVAFRRTLAMQKKLIPYRRLIDFLPLRQREQLILRYFHGEAKTQAEMSEITGKDRRNLNYLQKTALTNLGKIITAVSVKGAKDCPIFAKRGLLKLKLEKNGEKYIYRLSPRQESVVRLRYLSGSQIKTSSEIGKILGIAPHSVEKVERQAQNNILQMILKEKRGYKLKMKNQNTREAENYKLVTIHKELLKYLPVKQREFLKLRYLGNEIISHKEMSKRYNIVGHYTTMSMERRAIESLKTVIEKKREGRLPYLDERMLVKVKVQNYGSLVDSLSRLQRDIIKTRYLSGDEVKSLHEVGEVLGCSFKTVSRLEKDALKRLELFAEMKRKRMPIPDMDVYRQRDLVCEEIKRTPQFIERLPKLFREVLSTRYLQEGGVKSYFEVSKLLGYEKSYMRAVSLKALKMFRELRDSQIEEI